MKIERAWKSTDGSGTEAKKEITAEEAAREMANAHGADALTKLASQKTLETRFAVYTVAE